MRKLTQSEIYIINKLISSSNLDIKLDTQIENYFCEELSDGGMGSLKIISSDKVETTVEPILKSGDVQLTYQDTDTLIVNIALLLDQDDNLRELDCFKEDFSPLCEPLNKDSVLSVVKLTD